MSAVEPLDRDWGVGALLSFAFPTVVMMLFMGLYTMADSLFISRLVGMDGLSALNIVCPVINLTVGLGTMLATGGNARISRELGEGRHREAGEDLSRIVLAGAGIGGVLSLLGTMALGPLLRALGASPRLMPYCRAYLKNLLCFLPAGMLQTIFANLFVTAGRPGLGFGLSVAAGGVNIGLDWLLMGPLQMGMQGAALGTGMGYLLPTVAGIFFFVRQGKNLSCRWPATGWRALGEMCFNGSSELVGQLSTAVTTYLFNITMLKLAGEDGVAAITVLIYTQFLLNTFCLGFSMGVSPIFALQHGRGDGVRQRRVFRICLMAIGGFSAAAFALAFLGGAQLTGWFADRGTEVYALTAVGFRVFSISFLFSGFNGFASALLTALSEGRLSALLSFLRTFVFLTGAILLLPGVWGLTGVWLAVPAAELAAFFCALLCLRAKGQLLGYGVGEGIS